MDIDLAELAEYTDSRPSDVLRFLPHLGDACDRFAIVTPERIAAFMATCAVESAHFTTTEEDLNYASAARLCAVYRSRFPTLAAAQPFVRNPAALERRVYGGPYKGRGLIQLTGPLNYTAAGIALSRPYLSDPALVAQPEDASLTAAWFFSSRGCNEAADQGDINRVTRLVNGPAMLERDKRARLFDQCMRCLA